MRLALAAARQFSTALPLALAVLFGPTAAAQAADDSQPPTEPTLPRLVHEDGRHALIVDGSPFLILAGQCHNSSAWPKTLPAVWSAIEALHANTLEAPISWEQFEPEPGRFDTSVVDALLAGARERKLRLVLLWFGTWKNGSAHYLPLWLKRQPELCPRIVGKDGRRVDSPSPHAPALLAADTRAFCALMRHLKAADPQHTVILVQVENEPGAWNTVRDYSPVAQRLFAAPVPAELLKALGRSGRGDWASVFGKDANEFFHAWSVARFVGQVAAAGKAEYPLPMYANAALRDPISQPPAGSYESGGPTDNVLEIWKAAAPAVDLLAPDIYLDDSARYLKVLDLYARKDNALFVPETGRAPAMSRYFFPALARGAIGWSPFGIDDPPLAPATDATIAPAIDPLLEAFAANYAVVGPMAREIARLGFEGRLHAAVEEKDDTHRQAIALGRWEAVVTFGPPTFGYGRSPQGNPEPLGRVLVAQLGDDEFLVTAHLARVDFRLKDTASGAQRDFLRVEEGRYEAGAFRPERIWNGDETDWGLNFGSLPQVLRVQLGSY
jgi:hypothetical protein